MKRVPCLLVLVALLGFAQCGPSAKKQTAATPATTTTTIVATAQSAEESMANSIRLRIDDFPQYGWTQDADGTFNKSEADAAGESGEDCFSQVRSTAIAWSQSAFHSGAPPTRVALVRSAIYVFGSSEAAAQKLSDLQAPDFKSCIEAEQRAAQADVVADGGHIEVTVEPIAVSPQDGTVGWSIAVTNTKGNYEYSRPPEHLFSVSRNNVLAVFSMIASYPPALSEMFERTLIAQVVARLP